MMQYIPWCQNWSEIMIIVDSIFFDPGRDYKIPVSHTATIKGELVHNLG